jgi:tetratricopeptide (TPR) repeat protein
LNESPVKSPVDEMNVLIALADAYGVSGQFRESDHTFDRASGVMTTLGYDDTQKAVKLFNDWGLMLGDAGRPLQSANAYRRAIAINRTDQTESTVLPTLLHNYSIALRDLGRFAEAADYSDRARQRAHMTGNEILVTQASLQRSRIYRDQHQYAETQAILQELEPKLRSILPPGHYAFASFASEKSLLAEAQGNLPLAMQLANEALAIDEQAVKAGGQGAVYLPILLVRRSAVELKMGKQEQAAADAARAVDLLRTNMEPGALSSTMGRACLALGRALQMQGRSEAARSAFNSAAVNLQDTLGADHPETRAALELAALAAHP